MPAPPRPGARRRRRNAVATAAAERGATAAAPPPRDASPAPRRTLPARRRVPVPPAAALAPAGAPRRRTPTVSSNEGGRPAPGPPPRPVRPVRGRRPTVTRIPAGGWTQGVAAERCGPLAAPSPCRVSIRSFRPNVSVFGTPCARHGLASRGSIISARARWCLRKWHGSSRSSLVASRACASSTISRKLLVRSNKQKKRKKERGNGRSRGAVNRCDVRWIVGIYFANCNLGMPPPLFIILKHCFHGARVQFGDQLEIRSTSGEARSPRERARGATGARGRRRVLLAGGARARRRALAAAAAPRPRRSGSPRERGVGKGGRAPGRASARIAGGRRPAMGSGGARGAARRRTPASAPTSPPDAARGVLELEDAGPGGALGAPRLAASRLAPAAPAAPARRALLGARARRFLRHGGSDAGRGACAWTGGAPPELPLVPGHEIVGMVEEARATRRLGARGAGGRRVHGRVAAAAAGGVAREEQFCNRVRGRTARGSTTTARAPAAMPAVTNPRHARAPRAASRRTSSPTCASSCRYRRRRARALRAARAPLLCAGATAYSALKAQGCSTRAATTRGGGGFGGVGHLMVRLLASVRGADAVAVVCAHARRRPRRGPRRGRVHRAGRRNEPVRWHL